MEPGIYNNVPWEDYVRLPYMNASTLCNALITPQHLKSAMDGEMKSADTEDKIFGRALHAVLLEPETFDQRFIVSGQCSQYLSSGANKGKQCTSQGKVLVDGSWVCGTHVKKWLSRVEYGSGIMSIDTVTEAASLLDADMLTQSQYDRVMSAAAAVKKDKAVRLLKLRGGFEVTVIWDFHDVRCKSRLDKFCLETDKTPKLIIDLKKVQRGRGTDEHCQKAAATYHYDVKAQFYRHAIHHATGEWPEFAWVYVEDSVPYGINVFLMSAADKRAAEARLADCWSVYFSSKSSGKWNGYMSGSTKPKVGMLPTYML